MRLLREQPAVDQPLAAPALARPCWRRPRRRSHCSSSALRSAAVISSLLTTATVWPPGFFSQDGRHERENDRQNNALTHLETPLKKKMFRP